MAGRAIGLAKDPSVEYPQTGLLLLEKAVRGVRMSRTQISDFLFSPRPHPSSFRALPPANTEFAKRVPGAKISCVQPGVRADERKTTMADTMTNRGLTPGARRRIKRFYEQIDRNLAAWERLMFPKKKRRRGKRKRGRRRNGKVVDLLGGREVRHGA